MLAVVIVPAWLAILGPLFGREVAVEPRAVALVVAKGVLAPLLVGMLLRWPLAKVADRLSQGMLAVGGAALSLSAVGILALQWRGLAAVGWVPFLILAAMAIGALAIGHALGGPDPEERSALAVACATRHVGIALVIASSVGRPGVAVLVLANVLAAAIVSILYLKWRARGQLAASA